QSSMVSCDRSRRSQKKFTGSMRSGRAWAKLVSNSSPKLGHFGALVEGLKTEETRQAKGLSDLTYPGFIRSGHSAHRGSRQCQRSHHARDRSRAEQPFSL